MQYTINPVCCKAVVSYDLFSAQMGQLYWNNVELISGIFKPDDPQITEEARELWLRSYMEEKWRLLGRDPDNIPDVAMEKFKVSEQIYGIVSFSSCILYLTHWGRVTHICVGNLTITGPDNGLSPGRRQAIIWTNAGILLIGALGTNVSEILIKIDTFSLKKMRLKMSSGKRRHLVSASMC